MASLKRVITITTATTATSSTSQTPFFIGNFSVRNNSTRTTICRVNRLQFLRQYPTTVVNRDGSTFTIRYHEPRQIIKLPVDISLLSAPEKNSRHLERGKPKTKLNLDEEFEEETGFDSSKYLNLVKKN